MHASAKQTVLSAHPLADEVRGLILQQLACIEREHQVTILFACESGSRGWGFASPDSDYDVRFVYLHRLPWYLTVHGGRDVIEQPISGELDINGWELRKASGLMHNSNPVLLEWLRSPIIYRQHAPWAQRLHTLAQQHFSCLRGWHHYVSMAKKNLRAHLSGEQVRHKKYFYTLRPLLAARWIREYRSVPPMRFAELVSALVTDQALLDEINTLLRVKMGAGETATSAASRWERIHAFIERELALALEWNPEPETRMDSRLLDDYLREAVLEFSGH